MFESRSPRSYPLTALSAVNALGPSTAAVLAALDAERSGLGPSPLAVTMETVVGAVEAAALPRLPEDYAAYETRLSRLGYLAYLEVADAVSAAVDRWGPRRVAVVLGTSTGGLEETEGAFLGWLEDGTLDEAYDYQRQHNFAAFGEFLACQAGILGPAYVVSTACSSSGKVAASAQRLLDAGLADAVLVGGVDSLTRMTLQGFHSLGILSARACRPFDVRRDGINIGEGAAFLLIEREGDAEVHLHGVGESADAYRMSSPEPSGRGAREAMERALAQAGLSPGDVDHVNAHGTATQLNDAAEALAIRDVVGDDTLVSSTKGYTGHLLGAAGATEAVFAVHAIRHGRVPKTLNFEEPDEGVDIRVARATVERPVRFVLSNSFAFGGSNVSLLLGPPR
jgi:3-oxoacyl-[acyl-carrier-protein] synthase-1